MTREDWKQVAGQVVIVLPAVILGVLFGRWLGHQIGWFG